VENFTTANLDMIQHYRPRENVLARPTAGGGEALALTGHHEIMIPLLSAAVRLFAARRETQAKKMLHVFITVGHFQRCHELGLFGVRPRR